ncbi:MAG: DUF4136 domain-containing protein [Candidatus Andeanibacterium colombiense]|uniref:DUF4136 domain-containing protein n=1 Tax=Candidatus Andeanibacterium colombiense TaxID=3121345 RepID=A0AAJ5X9U6_9SPHN|nr:MAG: DUF4136 domain-containing protein [Sphingomonadaceae bacterium]
MTSKIKNIGRSLKLAAVPLMLAALAACTTGFRADVSRFQSQLPAPQGQTFAVVADDPKLAGGLEFAQYARLVDAQMEKLGYHEASPSSATLLVRFDYGVDNGRERNTGFSRDPFWSPWYGGGYGFYGRRGPFRGRMWGYGWYDPFFDDGLDTVTVYTSGIDLKIDNAADGKRLFEGKAEAVSTSKHLQYLVPNLVEAMFTNFPGNSGETVRITVAPETDKKP